MRDVFAIISFLVIMTCTYGQMDTTRQVRDTLNVNDTLPGQVYVLPNIKRDGLTLPEVEIGEVNVIGHRSITRKSDLSRYNRTVYNIKKVYPFALIVRSKLGEVNEILAGMPDDNSRKKFLRDFEKQVFKDYEDDMRHMTITQGKLLIKLIDRETQNTSYDLIRDYRGKFSAAFWQSIARIFGTNLKEEYDPYGEDFIIELIINEIELGRL